MRILVAGAGGTLGLPLVKRLVQEGHAVIGLTRSKRKLELLQAAGVKEACAVDALDSDGLARAVQHARPTHVVNLLTAIPPAGVTRPKGFRATNRLRTEGSANLLQASMQAGVQRLVVESFVSVYGLSSLPHLWKEDDPLPAVSSDAPTAEIVGALRTLEAQHAKAELETIVLRYGLFYGPAVPSTESMIGQLQNGTLFIPKHVQGRASWVHIEDAVDATVRALTHAHPSACYNIGDDEPIGFREALMYAADVLGARRPRSIPAWLLRAAAPLISSMTAAYLTMDNTKAKQELGWRPRFPNFRAGFVSLSPTGRQAA
jgi:nucleoside-diphosphate-sugar epimerase